MNRIEADTIAASRHGRTAIFVRKECENFVTEFEGESISAKTCWMLDTKLDGIAPQPRDLYLIDTGE